MQRPLAFASVFLGGLLFVLALASCGGEHFNRALVENTDAGADLQPVADAGDDGGELGGGEDGGDGSDARDATPSDATTCPPEFGGDLLYIFNNNATVFTGSAPPLSMLPPGWFAYAEMGGSAGLSDSTTAWSASEGHSCPGALALTANFTVYAGSERVMALVNFNANWASPKAYVRLHAWIKVAIPSTGNLDHLDGVLLATNTNNFNAFQGASLPASNFSDGEWHEIVRELVPGSSYFPAMVNQVGVQVIAKGVPPAGSSAPVPTTLFIDDIWLELPP